MRDCPDSRDKSQENAAPPPCLGYPLNYHCALSDLYCLPTLSGRPRLHRGDRSSPVYLRWTSMPRESIRAAQVRAYGRQGTCFCFKESLCFRTMPRRPMPLLVHFRVEAAKAASKLDALSWRRAHSGRPAACSSAEAPSEDAYHGAQSSAE